MENWRLEIEARIHFAFKSVHIPQLEFNHLVLCYSCPSDERRTPSSLTLSLFMIPNMNQPYASIEKKLVTDGRTGRRMDGQDLLQRCVIASKNTSSVFFMWTLNWLFRGCERGFSMIILYFIRFSLVRLVGIQRINPVIALVVAFLIVLVLVSPIFLHICIDFSWIYFFPAAQKFPTET